jgi:hypothetical protein
MMDEVSDLASDPKRCLELILLCHLRPAGYKRGSEFGPAVCSEEEHCFMAFSGDALA